MEVEVAYTHKGNIFTLKKEEGESNIRHSIRVKFIQSRLSEFDYNLLEKYSSVYADSVLHGIEFPDRVQKQLHILIGTDPVVDVESSEEDEKLTDAQINIEETYVTDASITSIETDNDIKISVLGKESFLKTDGPINVEDEPLISSFNHDVFSIKEGDESKGVSMTVEHASGEDVTVEACGNVECSIGADVLVTSLDKNGEGITGIIRKKSVEDLTKEFSASFGTKTEQNDEESGNQEKVDEESGNQQKVDEESGNQEKVVEESHTGSKSDDIPLEPSEESEEISTPENNQTVIGSESFSTPTSKEPEKSDAEIAEEQKILANPKTIIIEESDESSSEEEIKIENEEEIKIENPNYEENLAKLKERCNYFLEENRDIYQMKANVRISILNRLKSNIDETYTDESLQFIVQEYDGVFFENILNKVAKYQVKWNQSLDQAGNLDISEIDSNTKSFFTLELSKPIFSALKGNQNVFGIIANSQIESLILFIENFIGTMIHEICRPNVEFEEMIKKVFGHMTDSVSFSDVDLNEKDERPLRKKILDKLNENEPVIVKLKNDEREFKVLGSRNMERVTLDGLDKNDPIQKYENISHVNGIPVTPGFIFK